MTGIDGIDIGSLAPASEDASFRRYYRVDCGATTRIIMDAPPAREDCRPFLQVAGFLEAMGLNGAQVLQADLDHGFLLLSDLGSTLYLTELRNDRSRADRLYDDAIAALATMQRAGKEHQGQLPPYERKLLTFELSLFHDWLCERHLKINFSPTDDERWQACCRILIDNALQQTRVFVHRDFHSRNLMVTADNNPGILDFQDAVEGPLTYDLVSLLKDCYIRWPEEQVIEWALRFYHQINADLEQDRFIRHFDLMGVQRHLKASGIFARLLHRDGKTGYMNDVPRTLEYIVALENKYDELSFLVDLIRQRCLPKLQAAT